MHEHIDIYCERLDPSFWAEPLNAITNIAFIIASILAYRLAASQKPEIFQFKVLALIIGLVGIGSFLFHTFANKWSMLADVIPIAAFIYYSIWIFLRKIVELNHLKSWLILITFFAFSAVLRHYIPQDALNGSVEYLPAFIALFAIGFYTKQKEFFIAIIAFFASLTFRSTDMHFCDHTHGIGTHIYWHLLNGVVLYFVARGLIFGSKK